MIDDDQLRDALHRWAESHEPDLAYLRARVDAGRAGLTAEASRGFASAGSRPSVHLGRTSASARPFGRPGERLGRFARPAYLLRAGRLGRIGRREHSPVRRHGLREQPDERPARGRAAGFLRPAVLVAAVVCAMTWFIHPFSQQQRTDTPAAALGAAVTVPSVPGKRLCQDQAGVALAPYWISNNLWNKATGTGTQCVQTLSGAGPTIGWSTNWNWSGHPSEVKSFGSVILGWQWGWKVPNTGLPAEVSKLRSVRTTWSYQLTQTTPNSLDIAYDLWFHNTDAVGRQDPTGELRVVLNQTGNQDTPGMPMTRFGTYLIDGVSWNLLRSTNPDGWPMFTFVRVQPTTNSDLDLKHFIDTVRQIADPAGYGYLSSVEAGPNVRAGAGTLRTTSYSVQLR